jgi:5'-3' exoribonuclease 1
MGIPFMFSYIVKNHPSIIKKYVKDVLKVDNLYLDCNSIIYDAYSKMEFDKLTESVAVSIIRRVILKIEEYISIINPSKTVIIAFDGVAPVAKLEQQRSRRYKSWYQNEISKMIFKKDKNDVWNTTAITPGTNFMAELNNTVSNHFNPGSFLNLMFLIFLFLVLIKLVKESINYLIIFVLIQKSILMKLLLFMV